MPSYNPNEVPPHISGGDLLYGINPKFKDEDRLSNASSNDNAIEYGVH
jgi:hypothetical protein